MTTKDIIFRYIKRRKADGINYISSVHFEIDVPKYGKDYWQVTKLPSAYSREWRNIREHRKYEEIGIESVVEIINNKKTRIKAWELK